MMGVSVVRNRMTDPSSTGCGKSSSHRRRRVCTPQTRLWPNTMCDRIAAPPCAPTILSSREGAATAAIATPLTVHFHCGQNCNRQWKREASIPRCEAHGPASAPVHIFFAHDGPHPRFAVGGTPFIEDERAFAWAAAFLAHFSSRGALSSSRARLGVARDTASEAVAQIDAPASTGVSRSHRSAVRGEVSHLPVNRSCLQTCMLCGASLAPGMPPFRDGDGDSLAHDGAVMKWTACAPAAVACTGQYGQRCLWQSCSSGSRAAAVAGRTRLSGVDWLEVLDVVNGYAAERAAAADGMPQEREGYSRCEKPGRKAQPEGEKDASAGWRGGDNQPSCAYTCGFSRC